MSSARPYTFYTRVSEDGKAFTSRSLRRMMEALRGCEVEVDLRKRRRYRTNPQNAYYHTVVVRMVCDEFVRQGWEGARGPIQEDEVHEWLKTEFNTQAVLTNPETGEYKTRALSTTGLTRSEFSEYVQRIKDWAEREFSTTHETDTGEIVERKFRIPDPGEQLSADV